ncbi:unnamed protein product [Heligmosomoides polygyrus]|uniref:PH_RBD domain-containing protein n=1 Tax=Heligmosomoides polygyrus TaxID=6339 RepID=A0A183GBU9_HELPZ|nr:unnamed protein product [Heligmosomoides polygyrus]
MTSRDIKDCPRTGHKPETPETVLPLDASCNGDRFSEFLQECSADDDVEKLVVVCRSPIRDLSSSPDVVYTLRTSSHASVWLGQEKARIPTIPAVFRWEAAEEEHTVVKVMMPQIPALQCFH